MSVTIYIEFDPADVGTASYKAASKEAFKDKLAGCITSELPAWLKPDHGDPTVIIFGVISDLKQPRVVIALRGTPPPDVTMPHPRAVADRWVTRINAETGLNALLPGWRLVIEIAGTAEVSSAHV